MSGSQAAFRTTFTFTGGFLKQEQASRRGLPKGFSEFVCNFIDACRNIIYFFSKKRQIKMEKTIRLQTKDTDLIFRTLKKIFISLPYRMSYTVHVVGPSWPFHGAATKRGILQRLRHRTVHNSGKCHKMI
jgi:hypothetical protein